jgi:hypothetical protein
MPDVPGSSRTLVAELRMYSGCSRSFPDHPGRLPGLCRDVSETVALRICDIKLGTNCIQIMLVMMHRLITTAEPLTFMLCYMLITRGYPTMVIMILYGIPYEL